MIPPHLEFRRLKRLVSIEQVLAHRGLLGSLRRRGQSLVGPCPLHRGDNPTAFVVHLSRNLWRCFTACDSGGDVVELVRRLDSVGYRDVAVYLASLASTGPPPPTPPPPGQPPFRPFRYRLLLQPNVDFLRDKGISPSTALRFEAGAYAGRGFLEGCIGVRLHDPEGQPLGYVGRRLDPDQALHFGKWKFPPRLPRNQLLYNFHRVRHRLPGPLVLTECPWSVMRLDQLHIPAVALLGVHLSLPQRQRLTSVTRLLLLFDADPAGLAAAVRIQTQLEPTTNVRILTLPDGADPDDLPDPQLLDCLTSGGAPARCELDARGHDGLEKKTSQRFRRALQPTPSPVHATRTGSLIPPQLDHG